MKQKNLKSGNQPTIARPAPKVAELRAPLGSIAGGKKPSLPRKKMSGQ
jgi:hypothetical protein